MGTRTSALNLDPKEYEEQSPTDQYDIQHLDTEEEEEDEESQEH